MIDEEWLASLRFETPFVKGSHVVGLQGLGADHVVFLVEEADGNKVVLKTRRHHLGYHIREVPPFLTARREYDVSRVNDKLRRLVGRDDLDEMTVEYDRLYSSVIRVVKKLGVPGAVLASLRMGLLQDEVVFLLKSPGMRRRFKLWATMRETPNGIDDWILMVNGPSFPITEPRTQLVAWAKESLAQIENLPMPASRPDLLTRNPVYVWGAAVMDDFFTDEELREVGEYIKKHFGELAARDDALVTLEQCSAIAELLTSFLEESDVARFVRLCAECGFLFQLMPKRRFAREDADPSTEPADEKRSLWQRLRALWSGS
jgi:hypothetical protein